ncbi:MAG: nitroreductase/quinone reductase family protein [Candidatus Dormibacteraceae bacterium]
MSTATSHNPAPSRPPPSGPVRAVFQAPKMLYQWKLGWLLGRRCLAVTYRGRRSGRTLLTVLEVIRHDRTTGESIVGSGYGVTAGWYLSIKAAPALRVQTGRLDYVPEQRLLSAEEVREEAERFARAHPWELRLLRRFAILAGCIDPGRRERGVELLASFPMVAFRPREPEIPAREAPAT